MSPCCQRSTRTPGKLFILLSWLTRLSAFSRPPFYFSFPWNPVQSWVFLLCRNFWLLSHSKNSSWYQISLEQRLKLPLTTLVQRLSRYQWVCDCCRERKLQELTQKEYRRKANCEAPWALYLHPVSVKLSFSCRAFVTLIMSTWA